MKNLIFGFFFLMLFNSVYAQVPTQVADLNSFGFAYSEAFINYNGITYFVSDDDMHGRELWRTDGTTAGTYLFKEFKLGETGSIINNMVVFNNYLYFYVYGEGLWRTDGTESGTLLIKDFVNFSVEKLTHCGQYLIFVGNDSINGKELWKSDGTFAGTSIISDLSPGISSSEIKEILYAPGFFTNSIFVTLRKNGESFQNAYKLEYTPASGGAISSPLLIPDSDYAERLSYYLGNLYFFKGVNHNIFQKYNGTNVSNVKVFDPFSASPDNQIKIYNGQMFFVARLAATGEELWKSDGTQAGTTLVKDIMLGISDSQIGELYVQNGKLIFRANDQISGFELWQTDGTTAGTTLLYDIEPGIEGISVFIIGSNNSTLSFFGSVSESNSKLYKYDFSNSQLTLVKDFTWYSPNVFESIYKGIYLNNTIICIGHDSVNGTQLWKSDGTSSGTTLLKRIHGGNAEIDCYTLLGNKTFFTAIDNDYWNRPYITDGTQAGTILLANLHIDHYQRESFEELNGEIIFRARLIGTNDYELYKTNGTVAGTVLLKNINVTPSSSSPSNPSQFYKFNNEVYFRANDGVNGNELWKTDGTTAGTVLVKDISPGTNSTQFKSFTAYNGYLYFLATLSTNTWRLWRTDGTTAGTIVLASLFGTTNDVFINSLEALNNKLYFVDQTSLYGAEMWVYDITTGNKSILKDIKSGNLGSNPKDLMLGGNMLFFTADDGLTGRELYVSDGTSAGTQLINVFPEISTNNPNSSDPQNLTWVENKLLFSAVYNFGNLSIDKLGRELWKSNGSFLGTSLVKNINTTTLESGIVNPASAFYKSEPFTKIGSSIYFVATNGQQGFELWRSDGTTTGTHLVADHFEGFKNDGLQTKTEIFFNPGAKQVFYEATNGVNGRELWSFNICPNSLNISTVVPSPTQQQIALNHLISSSNITNTNLDLGNRNIKYNASKSIVLEPGFFVKGIHSNTPVLRNPTTVFLAQIGYCE